MAGRDCRTAGTQEGAVVPETHFNLRDFSLCMAATLVFKVFTWASIACAPNVIRSSAALSSATCCSTVAIVTFV